MVTGIHELDSPITRIKIPESNEVLVFCPSCKAFETLSFLGDSLINTRKFTQKERSIYHDCGSAVPCRLFHVR